MTTSNSLIKEYRWQSGTAGAQLLTFANGTNVYVSQSAGIAFPIIGEVKSIEFITNTTGSMFILQSGTNLAVYSSLTPSGVGWQRVMPAQFTNSTTGGTTAGSIAGAFHQAIPVCEPLILAFSGATVSQSGLFAIRYV